MKVKNMLALLNNLDLVRLMIKSFSRIFVQNLKLKKISFDGRSIKSINYTALPDNNDEFKSKFVDYEKYLKNTDVLIRRIVGLTSYYRSAQEGPAVL